MQNKHLFIFGAVMGLGAYAAVRSIRHNSTKTETIELPRRRTLGEEFFRVSDARLLGELNRQSQTGDGTELIFTQIRYLERDRDLLPGEDPAVDRERVEVESLKRLFELRKERGG